MATQLQHRSIVKLDNQGRLLIPAEVRQELGMKAGDRLTLLVEDGEITILTFKAGIRRAQRITAKYNLKKTLVDELIAERRAEAARE